MTGCYKNYSLDFQGATIEISLARAFTNSSLVTSIHLGCHFQGWVLEENLVVDLKFSCSN